MFHTSEIPKKGGMETKGGRSLAGAIPLGFFGRNGEMEQTCPKTHAICCPKNFHLKELQGFGFPLPEETGPYLCTQGVGGHLTHFFPVTWRYDTQLFDCLRT